jgi:glucosamine--fructose-6-phosphate aminotransferase (isomerizing)
VCGIVGYVGPKAALPVLIGGLEKLEYRGYDSAGVATISNGEFSVLRSVGKLANLKKRISETVQSGASEAREAGATVSTGIGHTRWATHGRPSETNAHPHVAGSICVVHNGIIENYIELRERLESEGCVFQSETDTEIAAHLINSYLRKSSTLLEAARHATADLVGSYALVVMSAKEPGVLVVAKNSTPVIVGLADGETFIASDIPAVLDYTRKIIILEDGELAEVRTSGVHVELDGKPVEHEPITVTWDAITAEKGGYPHFMLKEIHEQPQAVTDTFRGRIDLEAGTVFLDDVNLTAEEIRSVKRIYLVACGTAWHAALVTKFYIEQLARIPVEVDYGSEFRYRTPLVDKDSLFIAISQSGETADTLGSLAVAKELGAKTLAICNVVGSSISRKAGNVLYTHAGPEISVASTKAFVTQLTAGYLLGLYFGTVRGALSNDSARKHLEELIHLPTHITNALGTQTEVQRIAKTHGKDRDFMFLGRGILYPIALEGALKLKEISYLHAEGYPAGEMKHGPIALIGEATPVVMVLGHDGVNFEKAISNLKEVESRGAQMVLVTDTAVPALSKLSKDIVVLGEVPPLLLPIVATVPLQLLAYYVAVNRGTDVDQPRNLAKSVTVE